MKKTLFSLLIAVIAVSLAACGGSNSSYPDKAITIVAPSGAGGGWDLTARAIAKVLQETKIVDKTITVENRPGGGGAVFMADYATKEASNNYMLMVKSPPLLINNLKAEGNSPYGFRDTTPLAQLTKDYGAYAVKADSKYQSLQDVIDDLKKDPKSVVFAGGSAPGSMDHLVAILPAYKAGVDPKAVTYVSYDGGGEAVAALLGGNADIIATDASAMSQYVKAGQVRVLAVSAPSKLSGDLADVPTLYDLGLDAEFTIWRGIFGPKNMSNEAKEFWIAKLKEMNETAAWDTELANNGWEKEFRIGDDFIKFLEEQEALLKDMLTSLGMAK